MRTLRPMKLLDPKLDVVFKMLFAEPRNVRLLTSLLTAVLRPASPIAHVRVLDPELPKDLASDRGVRLDVLVELEDGKLIDVEMECDPRRARGARWLYTGRGSSRTGSVEATSTNASNRSCA